MKKQIARPVSLSAANTEPPSEFRLFPLGTVDTTKGVFILTPADASRCVERRRQVGNELSIDYGHGVFNEHESPQRAAGWIRGLEVRADGLWATGVTWTETAAAMIRAREQRYFSPAFMADEEGHIVEILNVALTLMPATHNLTPLVASRRSGPTAVTLTKRTSMEEKYVSAEELKKLADDLEKMAEGEESEKAELKKLAEKCRQMAEGGETLKKLADAAEPEKAADDKEEAEKTSDDEKKDEAEKASEDEEKKEEAKAASRIVAAAREATGEKDPSRIVGALKALGETQPAVVRLTARVAELEAADKAAKEQAKKDRVTALVKASATPGPRCKIAPAEVDALIGWGLKDEDGLKAYLDKKPALVAASVTHTPSGKPDKAAKVAALSADQIAIIRASGLTPEQFVEQLEKLPA